LAGATKESLSDEEEKKKQNISRLWTERDKSEKEQKKQKGNEWTNGGMNERGNQTKRKRSEK
jgi:hypothetical protein